MSAANSSLLSLIGSASCNKSVWPCKSYPAAILRADCCLGWCKNPVFRCGSSGICSLRNPPHSPKQTQTRNATESSISHIGIVTIAHHFVNDHAYKLYPIQSICSDQVINTRRARSCSRFFCRVMIEILDCHPEKLYPAQREKKRRDCTTNKISTVKHKKSHCGR